MTDLSLSTDKVKNRIQKEKKKLMLKTILIWRYKLSAESTLGIRYEIHTQNWRVFSLVEYGTPVKQTKGIREFKEEGDCLQLTIGHFH